MSTVTTVSLPATAIARLTAAVAAIQGVKFIGVTYRTKKTNELARYTLILGADYNTQVMQSRDLLAMRPTCEGDAARLSYLNAEVARYETEAQDKTNGEALARLQLAEHELNVFMSDLSPERAAAAELFNSYNETLTAHAKGEENPNYTKAGLYETIAPGLAVSRADGTFELRGLQQSRKVLEAGVRKTVHSSPKTLAKKAITATLPVGRYLSLSCDAGALESVRIGGNEIDVS